MENILFENVSLLPYNSFKINVSASYFAEIHSIDDFLELRQYPFSGTLPKLILGGGSNVLFTKNYNGLVIKNCIKGIRRVKEDHDYVWIEAGAGEEWHPFVMYCIENDLAGIENLSLIPGTVGAAPMQNIGAYGVEIKDVFERLEAVDLFTGEIKIFNKPECGFGYRESVFKNIYRDKYIITKVTFRLKKHPEYKVTYGAITSMLEQMHVTELSIRAISDAVIEIRRSKLPDPKVIGNAGSFFKNPEVDEIMLAILKREHQGIANYELPNNKYRIAAGWLIEQCGYKGKRVGDAGVHTAQALVLVNYGNATGGEILKLAQEIQQAVRGKFGLEISAEVNVV